MRGRKNKETVTASLCLAFTELVAPATATPDWSRHNRVHQSTDWGDNLSDRKWHSSLCGSGQSGIDFRDCFDFDRLSASSLEDWC